MSLGLVEVLDHCKGVINHRVIEHKDQVKLVIDNCEGFIDHKG
jgi:hypothetical protein